MKEQKRNTLRQTSKVGVKPTVYQGRQNQCPPHCEMQRELHLTLGSSSSSNLTGLGKHVVCVRL